VARAAAQASGTGTVLRIDTMRELARAAGFERVDLVPIDDRFHRLYRLVDRAPADTLAGSERAAGR
jgi:hypothetical protein